MTNRGKGAVIRKKAENRREIVNIEFEPVAAVTPHYGSLPAWRAASVLRSENDYPDKHCLIYPDKPDTVNRQ